MKISVVICTHNPREDFMNRVLESLKSQTLDLQYWELIIIDNGSKIPISGLFDISWHPNSKIVCEENLGSSHARVRGIIESTFPLILFVDDDNCLNHDYLQLANNAMEKNPMLGALGAGKILPIYEMKPKVETLDFMINLALRDEFRSYYSNEVNFSRAIPYSAGMIIRKPIALEYVKSFQVREFASVLGRTGSTMLLSGEDVDMALHACKKEYIVGVIPELEMFHLIPKTRLKEDYLVRIAAGHAYSQYILGRLWKYNQDYPENLILRKLRYWKKWFKKKGLARLVFVAEYNAVSNARMDWNKVISSK